MHKSNIPDIHESIIIDSGNVVFFEVYFLKNIYIIFKKRTYDTVSGGHVSNEELRHNKRAKTSKYFDLVF